MTDLLVPALVGTLRVASQTAVRGIFRQILRYGVAKWVPEGGKGGRGHEGVPGYI